MSVVGNRYRLTITPREWQLEVSDELTLLESATLADISLPSSCRNGTCRTCMCRLISGQVRYRIEWPGLSVDEKKEGFILPCVAYPESDTVIDVPGAAVLSKSKSYVS